jgi:hypothetical protein
MLFLIILQMSTICGDHCRARFFISGEPVSAAIILELTSHDRQHDNSTNQCPQRFRIAKIISKDTLI